MEITMDFIKRKTIITIVVIITITKPVPTILTIYLTTIIIIIKMEYLTTKRIIITILVTIITITKST